MPILEPGCSSPCPTFSFPKKKHCFNIILPNTATFSIRPLSLRFPNQNYVRTFYTAMNATFSKFIVVKQFTNEFFIFLTLQWKLIPSALALVDFCPIRAHYQLRTFQTFGMTLWKRNWPSAKPELSGAADGQDRAPTSVG